MVMKPHLILRTISDSWRCSDSFCAGSLFGKSSHGPALSYTLNQHGSCTPQPCALASFFIFGHRGHVKPLAHIGDSPEMDVSMCTPQPLRAGIVTASQLEEDLSLRELKTALCICAS